MLRLLKGGRRDLCVGKGGVGGRIRHAEIHFCSLRRSKILVGSGILYFVKRLTEHGVMRLFPIQQEVDGFPHFLIADLPVKIFVDDLRALFRCNIGEEICAQISGDCDIITGPRIPRGID